MDTKKLRQKILDLAIRGKLVPQDPNDEPASVLLERIRAEKERLIKEGKIKRSKKTASDDEIEAPFEIPESWEWVRLDDIAFITKLAGFEYTNYIADNLSKTTGIPLFKGKNVQDGKIVYEFESYIPKKISEALPRSQVYKKCLLTPYVGTIGNIGIHEKEGFYHLGSNVGKIELFNDTKQNVLEEYVRYFLMSNDGYKELTKHKKATAQESISIDAIRDCNIPLPPIQEQTRIITQIDYWLSQVILIEDNENSIIELIDKAKSKILDLAIHGKLVPQDPNDEPAIDLLKRINPKFEPCDNIHNPYIIPERWEWTSLGMIGKWQSGGTPDRNNKHYYNGDIPWLKIADLHDSFINEATEWITQEGLENSSAKYNPTGSVALAMYGSIGKVGILTFPATTNQAICVCSEYIIAQKFLFFYLISQRDNFYLLSGGGVQANISKQIIVKHPVPIPPMEEQLRIVTKIEELFAVLDSIKESLE